MEQVVNAEVLEEQEIVIEVETNDQIVEVHGIAEQGPKGDDGVSPTVTTSKTGKVTTITITDAGGTHTATINDGADGGGSGDMLKSTYDTNANGIVDNAEKVNNHTVLKDVPANAVFTDTTYTAGTGIAINNNVISNTQTSAEWGNITGTLSSQTDLNTALGNKQDKLTTQTAYTSKGSATKVPQITTNTLGQVTGITEVTITQPDISGKENTSNKSSSYTTSSTTTYPNTKALVDGLATKQATLVSGTNIKTINNNSILGSGNIDISGGSTYTAGDGINITNNEISAKVGTGIFFNSNDEISLNNATQNTLAQVSQKQDTLVSGTNIKTINNTSILGSGNITISGGGSVDGVTTRLNTDNETEVIGIYTTQNNARKIWEGTKAQYDAIATKDTNTYYYITDEGIEYATSTTVGGIKVRLDGTTLYIRNDGSNA